MKKHTRCYLLPWDRRIHLNSTLSFFFQLELLRQGQVPIILLNMEPSCHDSVFLVSRIVTDFNLGRRLGRAVSGGGGVLRTGACFSGGPCPRRLRRVLQRSPAGGARVPSQVCGGSTATAPSCRMAVLLAILHGLVGLAWGRNWSRSAWGTLGRAWIVVFRWLRASRGFPGKPRWNDGRGSYAALNLSRRRDHGWLSPRGADVSLAPALAAVWWTCWRGPPCSSSWPTLGAFQRVRFLRDELRWLGFVFYPFPA